jgi:hypothetical protein
MARRRNRLNWLYDNDLQQFTTPSGQIVTLLQIAQLLHDQVSCHHDFTGAWTGWRMRQNRLIAPGATFRAANITPDNLRAFSRWLRTFEGSQIALPLGTNQPEPAHPGHNDIICPPHSAPPAMPTSEPVAEVPGHPYEPRSRAKVVRLDDYRPHVLAR